MKAYVLINVDRTSLGQFFEVQRKLREIEGVDRVVSFSEGDFNLMLVISGENRTRIHDFVAEKIASIPGVTKTVTCVPLFTIPGNVATQPTTE